MEKPASNPQVDSLMDSLLTILPDPFSHPDVFAQQQREFDAACTSIDATLRQGQAFRNYQKGNIRANWYRG